MEEFRYECDDGYIRNGKVECQSDGNWSAVPGCVIATTTSNTKVPGKFFQSFYLPCLTHSSLHAEDFV